MKISYEDFYLHVGWPNDSGRYPVEVIASPCGETRQPVWQENKLNLPATQHVLDYLGELIAEPEQVTWLGQSLHEFLFPDEVNEIYRRCLEKRNGGLRIRLRIDPEELSLLPWEYCYDPRSRQYLALERQTPIVRYIAEGFAPATNLAMPHPVKLLVVLAAPIDLPELDIEQEERGIRQALKNVPVELTVLRHASIEKLHDALLQVEPHILHFSGHGVIHDGIGALALEKPDTHETEALTARQLRGLVNRMGIVLVVLNACETARHSTRDALMGVAQALIREEIPAVIAMQFLVSETVALLFTRRLYEFLFRGDPIEKIVTETRVGIDINAEEDCISWGIPVLFLRARDGFLWKPDTIRQGSGLESLEAEDLKVRHDLAPAQGSTTENILLKKVYRQWVIDVLSTAIPNAERRIDFVYCQGRDGPILAGKTITQLFNDHDSSFLLLGAPGAGKTIALCELARDLSLCAGQDEAAPIPVILRLATWKHALGVNIKGMNFKQWIDEQIRTQYGLGQTHLKEIKARGLILLLDGLDEVRREYRAACARAINEYCTAEGWVNLVVTCRFNEYAELQSNRTELTIPKKQVISIAELDADRIARFLGRLDRVGADVTQVYSLLENERTPLMTNVILQTYEGRAADQIGEVQDSEVWRNYVQRKFEDESLKREFAGTELPYEPEVTKKWLKWLAEQLKVHTQDLHRFFIEEIQPNWLPGKGIYWFYLIRFLSLWIIANLVAQLAFRTGVPIFYGSEAASNYLNDFVLIAAPLASLWITSFVWVLSRRSASYRGPIVLGLLTGLVFGMMIWIPYRHMPVLALIGGCITAIIMAILVRNVIRLLGFSDKDIICVKSRKWDWYKAGSGMLIGLAFITLIGLISDVSRAMFMEDMQVWPAFGKAFTFNTIVWWNWGLPGLFSMGLFFFFVLGRGWGVIVLRKEVDKPNQGIIDSGRTGIFMGIIGQLTGLIFSLVIGIPCYLGAGLNAASGECIAGDPASLFSGLGFGSAYGLVLGLIFGLVFGGFAWLSHYLVRLLLLLDHEQVPGRLVKFLRFACKLNLLRRVGGGYEFMDQELQAYFETLPLEDREVITVATAPG